MRRNLESSERYAALLQEKIDLRVRRVRRRLQATRRKFALNLVVV
jgi:hypothetical protein